MPLSVPVQTLHLHAEALWVESAPQSIRLHNAVQMFWGDYRLRAHTAQWLPELPLLRAQGAIEVQAPTWRLQAERLAWRPQHLHAQKLSFRYRGLQLKAETLSMQPELWRFEDVQLQLDESPWVVRVRQVLLQPQTETLRLQGVYWPGTQLAGPSLTLQLSPQDKGVELRHPLSVFQPELSWQGEQWQIGVNSQLWRSPEAEIYGRSIWQPTQGWRNQLGFEWQLNEQLIWNSRVAYTLSPAVPERESLSLQPYQGSGLQGRSELLWRPPLLQGLGPSWLRLRADWREPESFWQEFWLPPLRFVTLQRSGAQFWWGGRYRLDAFRGGERDEPGHYALAYRWPQNEGGLSWIQDVELWRFSPQSSLRGSVFANALFSQRWYATGGLKLLQQNQWRLSSEGDGPSLEQGSYVESYVSQLAPELFVQPHRLSPWLGSYALWKINAQWGLGADVAFALDRAELSKLDLMLSWRQRPLYVHLLLRGLPLGVGLQTRVEWF